MVGNSSHDPPLKKREESKQRPEYQGKSRRLYRIKAQIKLRDFMKGFPAAMNVRPLNKLQVFNSFQGHALDKEKSTQGEKRDQHPVMREKEKGIFQQRRGVPQKTKGKDKHRTDA